MVEEAIFTDVQVFEAPLITDDTEARPGEEHHQGKLIVMLFYKGV